MIYFFHHYELPVILQQAHTQDLLMRNQEGGGPPLIVAYEQGGRRINRNRDGATNNNNNALNNNNAGSIIQNRRMTGFNFGPFRFRLGVVLTTHQRNEDGANPQTPGSPPRNNHGHSHGNSNHGHSHGASNHGHSHRNPNHSHSHGVPNLGHSHGHTHGHQHLHLHQHGHQHLHSHGHSHNREESRTETVDQGTETPIAETSLVSQNRINTTESTSNAFTSQDQGSASARNSKATSANLESSKTSYVADNSQDSSRVPLTESEECVEPASNISENNSLDNPLEEIKNKNASESKVHSEKCDILKSSNDDKDKSTNHGNTSQDVKSDIDNSSSNIPEPNQDFDEISENLRQISAALKSTLPTDENSQTSN